MKLTVWGAARQVTGSMHMLELENGYTVLVDCGLDYENKDEFEKNNLNFPFLPEDIDLVILTHSHIDHSGNLPNLIRQGYSGQILCSEASVELTKNLLIDSLNVQRIELNKKKGIQKKHKKKLKQLKRSAQVQTLYNRSHVEKTIESMVPLEYRKPFIVHDELSVELYVAGHILGAASIRLEVKENGKSKVIGFTGDLGNFDAKLVKDPEAMPGLDYLVSESTYGSRSHIDSGKAEEVLMKHVQDTCVKFNGKLVIPAFSVGRTQGIIFTFNQLFRKGLLPPVKIVTDSPLAIKTTGLYARFREQLNPEAQEFYKNYQTLFEFENLYSVTDDQESKMLSGFGEPMVIISAAGMVEGGRIQEHVRNNIGDSYSTILIAGYCAEGTLGYELLQGRPTVRINKREKQVYAKIDRTHAFSAHPDKEGLIRYFKDSGFENIKKIILVHGDYKGMEVLQAELGNKVVCPEAGETLEL